MFDKSKGKLWNKSNQIINNREQSFEQFLFSIMDNMDRSYHILSAKTHMQDFIKENDYILIDLFNKEFNDLLTDKQIKEVKLIIMKRKVADAL